MDTGRSHPHRHSSALMARRLAMPLEASLIVMGVLTIIVGAPSTAVWLLLAWLMVALVYTAFAVRALFRAAHNDVLNRIEPVQGARPPGVWGSAIQVDVGIIGISSLMGLVGAISVLRDADASSYAVASHIVAALSIVSAWMLLQFGYARLYADSWFHVGPVGGLDFPGTSDPGLIEFAYFTFSVGATFQTSDTSVTSTHMRWLVTIHAVMCFFYNTILLAFAVSLITG